MPQVRKSGTAWERRLDDYAYTKGLDRPGWAWEFLRRNATFIKGVQDSLDALPKALDASGAQVFILNERDNIAEHWGLVASVDPTISAAEATVFWLPTHMSSIILCHAKSASGNQTELVNLTHFRGQKSVLVTNSCEYINIQDSHLAARLAITGNSIRSGDCVLNFNFEGIENAVSGLTAIRDLKKLMCNSQNSIGLDGSSNTKYRDYLIALDGYLAQRSYRDIAEVLYGSDRVKEVWTNETRHLKDKVRRAVAAGVDHMNGGYLKLLQ